MATTGRPRGAAEYPEAARQPFEVSKAGVGPDFAQPPAVARVKAWGPEVGGAGGGRRPGGAFADNRLKRRFKEALAFAVSVTTRSAFGTEFHLGEMRRAGVGPGGVMEILGVTQMFSSYTKIADTLQLETDMHDIAPVDWSPAPGGAPRHPQTVR